MSGLTESLIYIIQTLGQLYLLIVVLRFVLQLVRADFYNPLCQFTVKATQPLLAPLRRLIPSVAGLDLAGLVLAVLLQLILISSILAISGVDVLQLIPNILAWSLIAIGSIFLKIFFFALIISVILSWVAPGSHNPGGLDISPIFAFIAINLLERLVITNLAVSTGLTGPIRALVSPFL